MEIPHPLPGGRVRPGRCRVPGCNHPYRVGDSGICPVHHRTIREFDSWIEGHGVWDHRGPVTFDEHRRSLRRNA